MVRMYSILSSNGVTLLQKARKILITIKLNKMPFPVAAAIGAAATVGATGMGMANAAARNRKQFNYQKELMDKSYHQNVNMAMFNKQQQIDLWKETGPTGQMAELKKAGLNPALIYGMGGAGGQTAAAAQGQGQGTPQAPHQESGAEMGMLGLQLAQQLNMQKAQIENLNADTEKKKADAAKTSGVDTRESESRIEVNQQGIQKAIAEVKNIEAQTKLTEINSQIQSTTSQITQATAENEIAAAGIRLQNEIQEFESRVRMNDIGNETRKDAIKTIKANAIGAVLENTLRNSKIKLTDEQTKAVIAGVLNMVITRQQNWERIAIDAGKLSNDTRRTANDVYNNNMTDTEKMIGEFGEEIIHGLSRGR